MTVKILEKRSVVRRITTCDNFTEERKVSKRDHDVLLIRLVRLVKTKVSITMTTIQLHSHGYLPVPSQWAETNVTRHDWWNQVM